MTGATPEAASHETDSARSYEAENEDRLEHAAASLVALSEWIDAGNADRDAEAITWGRLAKITEEAGEVIAAYIGYTGQNPRKGVTHMRHDVIEELMDVAVTALGAIEHLSAHQGLSLLVLLEKIETVAQRAGVSDRG